MARPAPRVRPLEEIDEPDETEDFDPSDEMEDFDPALTPYELAEEAMNKTHRERNAPGR